MIAKLRWLAFAGFVALLAAGTASCGDKEVTITRALCHDVVCDEANGFECDGSTGQCLCGGLGGVSCLPGAVCIKEPTPQCGTNQCEFRNCERGMSCDGLTGDCQCGGDVCADDQVCVDNACKTIDRCTETACGGSLTCDPEDGRCKCLGQICGDGERCIDGQCTESLCFGMNCGLNNTCNPADGQCHCMGFSGPVCQTGDACLAETLGCAVSNKCDDVVCGGGTVCDPVDGLCHCGGTNNTGAPVCDVGQSCVDGKCLGGMLCAPGGIPNDCGGSSNYLSCDPQDGVCKCGGVGGPVCGDGETCAFLNEKFVCAKACDILKIPTGCGADEGCYFDREMGTFCAEKGEVKVGDDCEGPSECEEGLYCSNSKCAVLCDTTLADGGDADCITAGAEVQCVDAFRSINVAPPHLGLCILF